MSKVGKKAINIPESVQVSLQGDIVAVKGPLGEQSLTLPPKITVIQDGRDLKVSVKNPDDRRQKALWGTYRALLNNLVRGVTAGFERKLEIVGVGYRANVSGEKLNLNLGFSHPLEIPIPKGLKVSVEKNTLTISGIDRQAVGEFAANLRSRRPPEPYKGKGIRYQGETVRRKAGKVVKAVGT